MLTEKGIKIAEQSILLHRELIEMYRFLIKRYNKEIIMHEKKLKEVYEINDKLIQEYREMYNLTNEPQ